MNDRINFLETVSSVITADDKTFAPIGLFLTQDFKYYRVPCAPVTVAKAVDLEETAKQYLVPINFDFSAVYEKNETGYQSALLLCQVIEYLDKNCIKWEQTTSLDGLVSRAFSNAEDLHHLRGWPKIYLHSVHLIKPMKTEFPSLVQYAGRIRYAI